MAITGMVDNSPDGLRLGGWAKDEGGHHPLTIEATLDGAVIARTTTDQDRSDIGGRFGYLLEFAEPVALEPTRSGRLQVSARAGDGPATPLTLHANVIDLLVARDVGRQLAPLPLDRMIAAITFAAQRVTSDPARPDADRQAFARLERIVQMAKQPSVNDTPFAEPLTYVATAPGSISLDGSALIGHNGHIYLCAGTNKLSEQFELAIDDPLVQSRADGWSRVFQARAAALEQRGIRYVQTIIPDKVSVVPDYWPGRITTPSSALRAIEQRLDGTASYFSAHRALTESPHRIRTFRKIDTHMTWIGTRLLFDLFCRSAGIDPPFQGDIHVQHLVTVGDFTDRFPGLPLLERVEYPDSHALADAASGMVQTLNDVPDPHHHIGAHVRWHNPKAPIDKKLLVFGNSFFEYRLSPLTLGWWFARAFRDYEFIWNPDVDLALVDAVKPDIVIGQTIERFLPRVPDR